MPSLALAILAAGQSQRFGPSDKLCAVLHGKPLGLHVCDRLAALAFEYRWVVAADANHPCAADWQVAGFGVVENSDAALGMGTSVALAAQNASAAGADALLICLADMPLVPIAHYAALHSRMQTCQPGDLVVTADGQRRLPPAAFGAGHFERLSQLTGDIGARDLLSEGKPLNCSSQYLIDVDDPATLDQLQQN